MLRFLNIAAVTMLVATAGWAYQTKYETIRYAEEVRKLENKIEKERDQIAILKAEWQLLNRPGRLEVIAQKLDMRPVRPSQVARAQDLPERGKEVDHIGAKLDALLTGSITPSAPKQANKTPGGKTPQAKTGDKTSAGKTTPAKANASKTTGGKTTGGKTAAGKTTGDKTTGDRASAVKTAAGTSSSAAKR